MKSALFAVGLPSFPLLRKTKVERLFSVNGQAVGGENVQEIAILCPCSAVRAGTQPTRKLTSIPDRTQRSFVGSEGCPHLRDRILLVCTILKISAGKHTAVGD